MKILVLGTSNSILKGGWLDGLREAMPKTTILNASVGASPGTQFAAWLRRPLADFDAIIHETVINDENLARFVGDQDFFDRIMFETLSSLSSRSRLIVLGFTNQRFLDSESPTYRQRRNMTFAAGGEFVGFREMVAAEADRLTTRNGSIFLDDRHFALPVAFSLGGALARAIKADRIKPASATAEDFAENYAVSDCATLDGRIETRSNSLVNERFLCLREGQSIAADPTQLLLGVHINASQTSCTLRLHRPDGSHDDLFLGYTLEDKIFTRFVPITGGVRATRIEVLAEISAQKAPHSLGKLARPGEGYLEIGKLVYRKPFAAAPPALPDMPPAPPSALHLMTEQHFRSEIERSQQVRPVNP